MEQVTEQRKTKKQLKFKKKKTRRNRISPATAEF